LTNNSEILGEFFVNFFDNIYINLELHSIQNGWKAFSSNNEESFWKYLNTSSLGGRKIINIAGSKNYDTGTMLLTIVPLEKR